MAITFHPFRSDNDFDLEYEFTVSKLVAIDGDQITDAIDIPGLPVLYLIQATEYDSNSFSAWMFITDGNLWRIVPDAEDELFKPGMPSVRRRFIGVIRR